MRLQMTLVGEEQFNRRMLRITDRANDMRPAFNVLADDFYAIEERQFDSDGAYGGDPWPALKESTVARKAALNLDPRILRATGNLHASLTEQRAKGAVRQVSRTSMLIGTRVKSDKGFPYAKVHQDPRTSPLPQRRPVQFPEADRRRWPKLLQRYLFTGQL